VSSTHTRGKTLTLIDCAKCRQKISIQANSCPLCGHPRAAGPMESPPACHACANLATVRCQRCGKLCCVLHQFPIFVHRRKGGATEIRCAPCKTEAEKSNEAHHLFGCISVVVMILAFLLLLLRHGRLPSRRRWGRASPPSVSRRWESKRLADPQEVRS
jgi:hypothetical protein